MLFQTPTAGTALTARLRELDQLRAELSATAGTSGRWLGSLRRQARTSTARSSVLIEGYAVADADADALVSGAHTASPDSPDEMALACYAHAMDHVRTMADDPHFRWLDRVFLDLHFDACSFQRDTAPGRWRTGPIFVTSPGGGAPAYVGPDADAVPLLMDELVDWLTDGDLDEHVVVRAAMAHLHTISIHPFHDGNGRISRIVQSLVLARDEVLAPEFSSIEEHLGSHTPEYYGVLQDVQGGRYQPERDATPWISFCVDAHLDQARHRLRQIATASARWAALERLVERHGWPDRFVIALEQSLFDGTDRATYAAEADISPATATTDLRRLTDAMLLDQHGRGRNVRYAGSVDLQTRIAGTPG